MRRIRDFIRAVLVVMHEQYRLLFKDEGAVLVVVGAVFIYSLLYGAGYGAEVVERVPIAVVDHSHSTESRRLLSNLQATPELLVAYSAADMEEAKRLLLLRKVSAIVDIPADYERRVLRREEVTLPVYCDAGYFLLYRQTFRGFVGAVGATSANIVEQRPPSGRVPQIIYATHNLYNPSLGYGSFIMPAILLLILQQTALVGIGMRGGTLCEQRFRFGFASPTAILIGSALAYLSVYAVTATVVLSPYYVVAGFPMNGNVGACVGVLLPYLLAVILLSLALSTLFRRRESAFVWILWLSIPALLLSGASLPREAFPQWMYLLGQLLPSSSAIEAWIRVQSMGASFVDVLPEVERLWALVILYGLCAVIVTGRQQKRLLYLV